MRTLYFDCSMGAAGDMLMGALYELLEDQKFYLEIMNRLFPGVTVVARPGDTFQVHGTYMDVWIDGEEEGEIEQSGSRQRFSAREKEAASVKGIGDLLAHLPFPVSVIQNIREVYHKILEAESRVHGIAVSQIHFSRLGDLDALVDITGVCVALEMLKPDSICASPVCTGTGEIHCARCTSCTGSGHSYVTAADSVLYRRNPGGIVYSDRGCSPRPFRSEVRPTAGHGKYPQRIWAGKEETSTG